MSLLLLFKSVFASGAAASGPAYKSATGLPLYGPDGHPMHGCCCTSTPQTYRQWRYCDQGTGYALIDRWSIDDGSPFPRYFRETISGICFFQRGDEPTSTTPGTVMRPGVVQTSCGSCDCASSCDAYSARFPTRCVPNELTVTLSGLAPAGWTCGGDPLVTGFEVSSGTANGTYACQQNGVLQTNISLREGFCSWVASSTSTPHVIQYTGDCAGPDPTESDAFNPTELWVRADIFQGLVFISAMAVQYNGFSGPGVGWAFPCFAYQGPPAGVAGFTGTYANAITTRNTPPYSSALCLGGTATITEG